MSINNGKALAVFQLLRNRKNLSISNARAVDTAFSNRTGRVQMTNADRNAMNRLSMIENIGKILSHRKNISTTNTKSLEVALRGNLGLTNVQLNELNNITHTIVREAIQIITVLSVYANHARSRHGSFHEYADLYLFGLSGYLTMLVKRIPFYGANRNVTSHISQHVKFVFDTNMKAHYKVSPDTIQTYTSLIVNAIKHNKSYTEDEFVNLHYNQLNGNYQPNKIHHNKTYMDVTTNKGKAMAVEVVKNITTNVRLTVGNGAIYGFKELVTNDVDSDYVTVINRVLDKLYVTRESFGEVMREIIHNVRKVPLPNEFPKVLVNGWKNDMNVNVTFNNTNGIPFIKIR